MSRTVTDDYYISHGGPIPVKWTAPEVIFIFNYESTMLPYYYWLSYRLSITRSTPVLVMCGVMELSCTRYGVWDINRLKMSPMIRYGTVNSRWSAKNEDHFYFR